MQRLGFVVYPDCSVMALAAVSAFEVADLMADGATYDIHFVSERGGPVRTSAGMTMETEIFGEMAFDTLVVGGGSFVHPTTPDLVALVRRAAIEARRVAAICTGAFILGEAGLLDGRRVTTHWMHARELQSRFPACSVEPDRIYVTDGPIWTSAGMSAGLDLALALIEADLGQEVAKAVARKLVLYHRRAGGQSQFSTLLDLGAKSDRIQAALTYAKQNLHRSLSVEELAEAARLSPRQFSRVFHAETGQSPAKAVETLRVEAARVLMERSRHPVDAVADQTGFSDRNRMRRAFLRAFGQPPQVIRRNARGTPDTASA
ncbi:GlxA family transcriptional regulator [Methylobacterium sp. Gmos1]